jgi:hypothetical protein
MQLLRVRRAAPGGLDVGPDLGVSRAQGGELLAPGAARGPHLPLLRHPRRQRLAQLRRLRFGQGQGLAGELRARRELFAQAIHGVADADLGYGQQHHQDAGDVRHRVEQRVEVLGVPAPADATATHDASITEKSSFPSAWIAIFPWRTPLRVASWDARS